MNTVTEIAPVISASNDALRRDFPLKPFAIRHKLAGHPLLTLPRIAQLASELPRDLIEYNSGKVAISQDPDAIPSVDLDPVISNEPGRTSWHATARSSFPGMTHRLQNSRQSWFVPGICSNRICGCGNVSIGKVEKCAGRKRHRVPFRPLHGLLYIC